MPFSLRKNSSSPPLPAGPGPDGGRGKQALQKVPPFAGFGKEGLPACAKPLREGRGEIFGRICLINYELLIIS
jgi:hypothetical protein